ncbi:BREX-1 system adenine-specific DNA-methyltransferase PglX [Clostridium sp. FP2]|uniref:BREX-1 system adenine-specific DNA-methyltransferase PglX n=1 Tax=Clostridium sp. FP2 TaxID=2724481 RepID=UPI0013E93A18|nr:BREX-1 system adenine-specific DNA-methyltransferase PglX [Clostridium sp. FP2]MBZ9624416.1 BREX-1 system adenine-specific DNA-methyltransferase PglX [Clostridium sp. FP2]
MDKRILKEFSASARTELISQITLKANSFGIYRDSDTGIIIGTDYVTINGNKYDSSYAEAYSKLLKAKANKGFDMLMEQIAYTWFNRFIALRFMEVNDYLPSHIRILSSEIKGKVYPDILEHYDESGLSLDLDEIDNYIKLGKNQEAYRKLLIAQCNELSEMLPFLFEKINDYTDMLLPENLLTPESIINKLVNNIAEEDFYEVETIGWIYQYYISDKKDEVINAKKKYKKEEIPFATQLFTPDWIVRYMVQNSLGRYWVESHPEQNELKKEWEFYLENPNPESDFEEKIAPYVNKDLKVEDIKCFDPCCGSGHILVYMFDVLYQIYEECGYMSREIPKLIIENNLYGLDIDDRAYQLACFAVIMKGMKYNNRLLRSIEKEGIKLNIASIQETNTLYEDNDTTNESDILDHNDIAYIAGEAAGENYESTKAFIEQFKNAKIYGSLIKVEEFDKEFLEKRSEYIFNNPVEKIEYQASKNKQVDELLGKLIKQADIMSNMYDVLVTNPPYMGSKYMNDELSKFLEKNYKESKIDTCTAFMEVDEIYVKPYGMLAMINQHSWMFLSSSGKLRENIINKRTIYSMLHLGTKAFEEINGEVVQSTAFVMLKNKVENYLGKYIRLVDFNDSMEKKEKTIEATKDENVSYSYTCSCNNFRKISGSPIAYWVSKNVKEIFESNKSLSSIAAPRVGLQTGDNSRFLRLWYEVNNYKIFFGCNSRSEAKQSNEKWFPYNKGGAFRKWYGNNEFVINWEKDGLEVDNYRGSVLRNPNYYFRKGITWSDISSTNFGVRYSKDGFIFDVTGSMVFPEKDLILYLTGFLCSKIASEFLNILNPTMHFQVGNIGSLPIILLQDNIKERIDELVKENIIISEIDWNTFEISWDFKRHQLLQLQYSGDILEKVFVNWNVFTNEQFTKLKTNEEELNKIFMGIYGLQDEMTPEVQEKDVTIRKADRERDIKSFISYAVGCMFGRYSLDEEGLIFAGGEFDPSKYKIFQADTDGILPILSQNYFEDDVTTRLVEFIKITFGEENLNKNLDYIAETLGKKNDESSIDAIRRYFIDGFYADHCKVYKKRPIYWLVDSGKKKGFRALIYIHRYNTETLATLRVNYLLQLQSKYINEEKQINKYLENENLSVPDKKNYNKKLLNLSQMQTELLAFDKVLDEIANSKIALDLDDGVVENYKKMQGILAKIK